MRVLTSGRKGGFVQDGHLFSTRFFVFLSHNHLFSSFYFLSFLSTPSSTLVALLLHKALMETNCIVNVFWKDGAGSYGTSLVSVVFWKQSRGCRRDADAKGACRKVSRLVPSGENASPHTPLLLTYYLSSLPSCDAMDKIIPAYHLHGALVLIQQKLINTGKAPGRHSYLASFWRFSVAVFSDTCHLGGRI